MSEKKVAFISSRDANELRKERPELLKITISEYEKKGIELFVTSSRGKPKPISEFLQEKEFTEKIKKRRLVKEEKEALKKLKEKIKIDSSARKEYFELKYGKARKSRKGR